MNMTRNSKKSHTEVRNFASVLSNFSDFFNFKKFQALLEIPEEPQVEGEQLLGAANEHRISAVSGFGKISEISIVCRLYLLTIRWKLTRF